MIELTDEFVCDGDDGQVYTVLEYTDLITHRPLSGASTTLRGMKTLKTSDGKSVNSRGGGLYEVVVTDVKLRRRPS